MITVIIPTYNESQNIEKLLTKIFSLNIPDLEIIVVDDNSPDGTSQIVQKLTTSTTLQLTTELRQIIADELNVKSVEINGDKEINGDSVIVKEDSGLKVALHTAITDELKKEGLLREVVRAINQIRKEQKLTISDSIVVGYETNDEMLKNVFSDFSDELKKSVFAKELKNNADGGTEIEIDNHKIKILLSRCG